MIGTPSFQYSLSYFLFFSLCLSGCFQSGSQACEGFREQLETLIRKAEEAEEVLKEPDSVGSPELTVVQTRMEKLKVQKNAAVLAVV